MSGLKLRNHVVTRGYLAAWKSTDSSVEEGLWYFDMASREVLFSKGVKASFAIKRGIYAPYYLENRRDDRLENWFAESEGDLCDFARRWSDRTPTKVVPKRIKKALLGCVSLGYRSEYSFASIAGFIRELKPDISDIDIHIATANNCYQQILTTAERFRTGTILIVRNLPQRLFTNDQPFLDWSPISPQYHLATFPLTPRCLMTFLPTERVARRGDLGIVTIDGSSKPAMAEIARKVAMHTARRWVVCSSLEDAQEVKAYLTEAKIEELASTDRLLTFDIEEVRQIFPTSVGIGRRSEHGENGV